MKNKLLLPLLGLLAAAVALLWWMGQGPAQDPQEAPLGLVPDEALAAGGGAAPEILPEVLQPEGGGTEREAVLSEAEVEVEPELLARSQPVSNAVWLPGRVVFPDNMPNDMGGLTVTARGRKFSEKSSRREHTVDVALDGSFRVALSKETRKGWVDLKGRYLYLDEKLRLDMDELPDELVLEPQVGGIVRGTVQPPRGLKWTEAAREGARVNVNSWTGGRSIARSAPIDEGGGFELTAVPPGNSYWLRIQLPLWCDANQGDVQVKSGEVTDVNVEVEEGSTITGRVVDQNDQGLAGVPVELSGTPSDGSWMHDTVQTEADGSFAFRGVKDGEVTIKAVRNESLPVEEDLGRLPGGSRREGIVLRLDEGDFIEGMVRWPDGSAATNAAVSVSQDREVDGLLFNFSDAITEKTDGEGRFRITGLESSVCQVRAAAKSYRPQDLAKAKERAAEGRKYKLRARGPLYKTRADDIMPGTSGLVLVLGQGSSLSGRVVDDQGEGLTRFLVTAEPVESPGSDLEDEDAINRICVSLDGSFTIDGLQDGQWKIRAKSKDHEITDEVLITAPGAGEIELVANRFAEVSGIVRSPAGEPVSGARVFVDRLDDDEEFELDQVRRSWGEDATTDQNGKFTARDVAPGRQRISASADGFGSSQGLEVLVDPGAELADIGLRLRRSARIRGQLHASVGKLEGRDIRVRVDGGGNFWESAETDAGGAFEVDGLDAGTYRLTLDKDGDESQGYVQRDVVEVVELDDGQQLTLVMGAPPANPTTVSGRVMAGSRPAEGVVVSCRSNSDGELDNDATRTASDGSYSLILRGSGSYRFQVGNPERGMIRSSRELVAGENPGVDFHLPVGSISGTVIDMDGEALEGCRITLIAEKLADEEASLPSDRRVTTDEAGRYAIDHVAAGTYSLRAEDNRGYGWRQRNRKRAGSQLREGLVVAEGASLESVDFDLELEGEISGSVTGTDGLPVQGARIRVTTPSGKQVRSRSVHTDSAGNFSYGRLSAGRYLVRATYGEQESRELEVRVHSGEESPVQLNLRD